MQYVARLAGPSVAKELAMTGERIFATLLGTDDHEEGVRAFEEEEYTPEFTGT